MENPYLIVLQEEKEVTKEYHQLLKQGTTNEDRYGIGLYKEIPNIAGDQQVAEPYEVPGLMDTLLIKYIELSYADLHAILDFHHHFELIHPFQDGNAPIRPQLKTA